jgi:hypothetical protein
VSKERLPNGEHLSPFVGRLVYRLSKRHKIDDRTDFDRRDEARILRQLNEAKKQKAAEGLCLLQSSCESHWVAAFAEHVFRNACKRPGANESRDHSFFRFFEIPSPRSEIKKACGYDLSIGPFRSGFRYRTMHKTVKKWCDRGWTWSAKEGDLGHSTSLSDGKHAAFLVLHVFFCIHDWRRMGTPEPESQVVIPPFTSLLRTLILNIKAIPGVKAVKKWKVRYRPPAPSGDTDQLKLESLVSKSHYEISVDGHTIKEPESVILDLKEFCGLIEKSWGKDWHGCTATKCDRDMTKVIENSTLQRPAKRLRPACRWKRIVRKPTQSKSEERG